MWSSQVHSRVGHSRIQTSLYALSPSKYCKNQSFPVSAFPFCHSWLVFDTSFLFCIFFLFFLLIFFFLFSCFSFLGMVWYRFSDKDQAASGGANIVDHLWNLHDSAPFSDARHIEILGEARRLGNFGDASWEWRARNSQCSHLVSVGFCRRHGDNAVVALKSTLSYWFILLLYLDGHSVRPLIRRSWVQALLKWHEAEVGVICSVWPKDPLR